LFFLSLPFNGAICGVIVCWFLEATSPFNEQIVRECRGLIVDKSSSPPYAPISFPYTKFFNLGEENNKNCPLEKALKASKTTTTQQQRTKSKTKPNKRNNNITSTSSSSSTTTSTQTAEDHNDEEDETTVGNNDDDDDDMEIRVYEKLDGSLAVLYYYGGEWNVSSSGVPDGSAFLYHASCKDLKFCDLFWSVWKEEGYSLPKDENYCYFFELMSTR